MSRPRHLGIVLISIFALVSGMNEVVVGLTSNFLGILSHQGVGANSNCVVQGAYCIDTSSALSDFGGP